MVKCPDCEKLMIGVEYGYDSPDHYDGVSEWWCPDNDGCGVRIGRWSGKRLVDGETEPRYGAPREDAEDLAAVDDAMAEGIDKARPLGDVKRRLDPGPTVGEVRPDPRIAREVLEEADRKKRDDE